MSALVDPAHRLASAQSRLPWVSVMPTAPYFQLEDGTPWHPIGHNDAICWDGLDPLYRRRNVGLVRSYLENLKQHGITCLRLMLEYAEFDDRYFEDRVGQPSPDLVQYWDDLFEMCEDLELRILLTPYDTFWMWLHFDQHPYSQARGGPLTTPAQTLISPAMRRAIKGRLAFAVRRWGCSGALFAWDLWNEIHPAQAEMSASPFFEFIQDLSAYVRALEHSEFGRSHPQTVSLFGPELEWRAEMQMDGPVFQHPLLDFANLHIYAEGTIDDPKNTVDAAVSMGNIVRKSLNRICDRRPFFDSEHGPIHTFKDHGQTLPESFDNEYFAHLQWAHLASGGAGGGMRWPNRTPHSLTDGMRAAQLSMARFLPQIDWSRFDRRNTTAEIRIFEKDQTEVREERLARFACQTDEQALVYLLRRDSLLPNGQLNQEAEPLALSIVIPGLRTGRYRLVAWNTALRVASFEGKLELQSSDLIRLPPLITDIVLAITPVDGTR